MSVSRKGNATTTQAAPKDKFLAHCRALGKAEADGSIKSAELEKTKLRQVDLIILAMQEFAEELPALVASKIKSPKARLSAGFQAMIKSCDTEVRKRIKAYKKAKKALPRKESLLKKHATRGIKARQIQYQDVLWYADEEMGRGIAAFQDLVAKPGKGEKPLQWTTIARRCAVPRIEAAKKMRAVLNVGLASDQSVFYLGKDVESTHEIKTRTVKDDDGNETTERYCQTARNDDEDVEVVLHQIPGGLQYKACLSHLGEAEPPVASWTRFLKDCDDIQRLMHDAFQIDRSADDE